MRANCELTLPMERQIIISGIGLGLRFFDLINFFTQSNTPPPATRVKSPPETQPNCRLGVIALRVKLVYARRILRARISSQFARIFPR